MPDSPAQVHSVGIEPNGVSIFWENSENDLVRQGAARFADAAPRSVGKERNEFDAFLTSLCSLFMMLQIFGL